LSKRKKFYGKNEEILTEHFDKLVDLSTLFGNDDLKKQYMYLKMYGSDDLYITLYLLDVLLVGTNALSFFDKLLPRKKGFSISFAIIKFVQVDNENCPHARERFMI
jgi:hypothetical protein